MSEPWVATIFPISTTVPDLRPYKNTVLLKEAPSICRWNNGAGKSTIWSAGIEKILDDGYDFHRRKLADKLDSRL